MPAGLNITCPNCDRAVGRSGGQCPLCGANVDWMSEDRRLSGDYLRYFSVSILGGILLSIVVLMFAGMLTQFSKVLIPVCVALATISVVLWLVAEHLDPSSSPTHQGGQRKL